MSSGFLFLLHAVGRPKEGHQVVNLGMGYRDSSYRQNGVVGVAVSTESCEDFGIGSNPIQHPKK